MSFSSYHWSSSSTGKFWWWCIVILGRISTVIMMVLQAWNMHSLVPVQQQKYKMFVLLCWFSWASGNFLWVSLLFADILWTGHFLKICFLMNDEMIAGTAHTARRGAGSMKNKLISESTMTSEFKSRLFSFLTFFFQFRDRRLHSWAWQLALARVICCGIIIIIGSTTVDCSRVALSEDECCLWVTLGVIRISLA